MRYPNRLYNLIFPIWMLLLFPMSWLFVLPANFITDSFVLLISLYLLKQSTIKIVYKQVILKIWGFRFLSDLIGALFLLSSNLIDLLIDDNTLFSQWWTEQISSPVSYQPFESIWSFLWVTAGGLIAMVCIYWFNLNFSLRKIDLEVYLKKKICLSLAIITAPYLFYLPTILLYQLSN